MFLLECIAFGFLGGTFFTLTWEVIGNVLITLLLTGLTAGYLIASILAYFVFGTYYIASL